MARTQRIFIVKETGERFQATTFFKQGKYVMFVRGIVTVGEKRELRNYTPKELKEVKGGT